MNYQVIEKDFTVPCRHRVYFTNNSFDAESDLLESILRTAGDDAPTKVFVVMDEGALSSRPQLEAEIKSYFSERPELFQWRGLRVYPGGEVLKNNFQYLSQLYAEVEAAKLCRHSCLIGIGGGALLDMVGLVAATAHRGIRHVRFPTTSLSQADGGVGVKNGINYLGKKNFIGSFAIPHAVVNDHRFIESLPQQQFMEGAVEAIKVALIRNGALFEAIEAKADLLLQRDAETSAWLIQASAREHVEHIADGGDPFENQTARPLDFGHWVAHKLESMSGFRISHGEAVAIGMAVDVLYSQRMGFLSERIAERILSLIERLGFTLYAGELSELNCQGSSKIIEGLEEFREHLGGRLTITLLRGIGASFEVHEMDAAVVLDCIETLRERHGEGTQVAG
jgi:3-dehydroquinate synthase|tara:strand:+ start:106 stop:1290 length:1185 start_codon:yes stop_codon:yes gene_type:complete